MPKQGDNETYSYEWFHVELITGDAKVSNPLHLNTVLLILVAVSGFIGNMIHLATSFTTFVGAGKFRRSWILWYCVKPFTASALAIAVYCILQAGLLAVSDAGVTISVSAEPLEAGKSILVTITGKNLEDPKLEVLVADVAVDNVSRKADEITFSYVLPDELKDKPSVLLTVKNLKAGPFNFPLQIKSAGT